MEARVERREDGLVHATLWMLLGLLVATWLSGCATTNQLALEQQRAGFNQIQAGFASLEETPGLNTTIELKNVRVHIVGDRNGFNWSPARGAASGIAGYANTDNEIWLFGKVVNGRVIVNQAILGHEFNHLLGFKDPKVANPDKLEEVLK